MIFAGSLRLRFSALRCTEPRGFEERLAVLIYGRRTADELYSDGRRKHVIDCWSAVVMLRNSPARWHIDDLNSEGIARDIRQLLL